MEIVTIVVLEKHLICTSQIVIYMVGILHERLVGTNNDFKHRVETLSLSLSLELGLLIFQSRFGLRHFEYDNCSLSLINGSHVNKYCAKLTKLRGNNVEVDRSICQCK